MLQAFYTATVGAQQQMERMGVQGNNMANANTFGFRAEDVYKRQSRSWGGYCA